MIPRVSLVVLSDSFVLHPLNTYRPGDNTREQKKISVLRPLSTQRSGEKTHDEKTTSPHSFPYFTPLIEQKAP